MAGSRLNILSPTEFQFIEEKEPEGSYDRDTRETLYWIIEKLRAGGNNGSRLEKKLYKRYAGANFGILLAHGTVTFGKILHPGTVAVHGQFEGEIVAEETLFVERTGNVVANVTAKMVVCAGKIEGDIRADHRVKIRCGGQVWGNIFAPSVQIEKGAVFEGRCHMGGLDKDPFLKEGALWED